MDTTSDSLLQKSIKVILISLALALVFNCLFFGKLIGISVIIFTAVLLGAVFLFNSRHGIFSQDVLRKNWWLVALISFFSLMSSFRANEFLNFLNICAALGLLMLLANQLIGTPVVLMRLWDYLLMVVVAPFRMLARALGTLLQIGQYKSSDKNRDIWLRILKGTLMALPILVVFVILFQEADMAFYQFTNSFGQFEVSERTMQSIALFVFTFVAGLSYLSYIFFTEKPQPVERLEQDRAQVWEGRGMEVMVALGLIAALFLVFIFFQVTYLFGGESNIINAGFTYAEYARRGFWELLAVGIISLAVLLAAEKYAGAGLAPGVKPDRRFLIPSLILIAEVVVIIVSAFKRMSLYTDAYGQTIQRFYGAAFIILLLVLFILLAYKFLKSNPEQFFTFGALMSGAAFLILVNLVNPDAFIAQSHLEQFSRTGKVDVQYVGQLSADSVAEQIDLYDKVQGADKDALHALLLEHKADLQEYGKHWQSANVSRSKALKLLQGIN